MAMCSDKQGYYLVLLQIWSMHEKIGFSERVELDTTLKEIDSFNSLVVSVFFFLCIGDDRTSCDAVSFCFGWFRCL